MPAAGGRGRTAFALGGGSLLGVIDPGARLWLCPGHTVVLRWRNRLSGLPANLLSGDTEETAADRRITPCGAEDALRRVP